MSAVATVTVAHLEQNISEAKYTISSTTQPSVTRLRKPLTETKHQILSNISPALRADIEHKRRERAALRKPPPLPETTDPIDAALTNLKSAWATTTPSRPALELARQPPYCDYRPPRRNPGFFYHTPSHGRPCICESPHPRLEPQKWRFTPAEGDYASPNIVRESKVRFSDNPVSEVRVFERWYEEEYVFSDRYWSAGPVRATEDFSSVEDDEFEMGILDAVEGMKGLVLDDFIREGDDGDDEALSEIDVGEIGYGMAEEKKEDKDVDVDGGVLVRMVSGTYTESVGYMKQD